MSLHQAASFATAFGKAKYEDDTWLICEKVVGNYFYDISAHEVAPILDAFSQSDKTRTKFYLGMVKRVDMLLDEMNLEDKAVTARVYGCHYPPHEGVLRSINDDIIEGV